MLELVFSRTRPSSSAYKAPWSEASDLEVLMGVRDSDEGAFSELIERKTHSLLKLCKRILGDCEDIRDVVQVTFFKVWENRHKFDEKWSPNTWMYRIASNMAIDHLRARKSHEKCNEPVRQHTLQVLGSRAQRDLTSLNQGEVAAIFRELSAELSEKQRVVFLLREIEGLSSQETADVLRTRESTVRNHLFAARQILRRELARRYPEYAGSFAGWGAEAAEAEEAL